MNNMYKYNIYIGMFDKDTKQQEITGQDYFNKIRQVLRLNKIDNYTIYKAKGHYRSELQVVCEPTIVVEIIDTLKIFYYLPEIKSLLIQELNQEDILITKQEVEIL